MNIKNAGTANAGAFRLSIFVNNTNIHDFVYTGLAAGQSATATYDMTGLQSGNYTYNFSIDSYNTVVESTDQNNEKHGIFHV
jgi:subtilase family serine protease